VEESKCVRVSGNLQVNCSSSRYAADLCCSEVTYASNYRQFRAPINNFLLCIQESVGVSSEALKLKTNYVVVFYLGRISSGFYVIGQLNESSFNLNS
jgi:hypothetical protein